MKAQYTPQHGSDNIIDFAQRSGRRLPARHCARHDVAPLHWREKSAARHGPADVPAEVVQTLKRLEQEDRPAALCVLRLDQSRLLEETFGFHIAQVMMQRVSERLRHHLRGDDLLAQISENEFLILLNDQRDNTMLSLIADRLLRDCTGNYTLEGRRMRVNGNLGIARFPLDSTDPALLMRYTRVALHETRAGNSSVYRFFNPRQMKNLEEKVWLAAELERALAEERFELHYQPLFDITTQRTIGAEALLRLRSDEGELIQPDRFIPLAEELGLIVPMGQWVIREACRQLKQWHRQGHDQLCMSVNVSPIQLADEDFVTQVIEAVDEAGIAYGDLELEITEGQIVEYLPLVERAFDTLSRKGIRISIDDFGTGYSALAYLTRLHWSKVKIDRAFLTQVPHDVNACKVVSAIIAMAGQLGLRVTAEGVETEAQYRFLANAGCHLGQGYGYARPQPATDFLRLLQSADGAGWRQVEAV